MQHKTFTAEVVEKADGGGQIRISTAGLDRDRDRVMSRGALLENYMRNPIVQWGHGYYEPWQTIGRTTEIRIGESEIVASFELRPSANEADPQNIVRLLWDGGWVKTASIGFQPVEWTDNEFGGMDITKWELLEWSLVPIPANQDALRLAAKGLETKADSFDATVKNPPIVVDGTTFSTMTTTTAGYLTISGELLHPSLADSIKEASDNAEVEETEAIDETNAEADAPATDAAESEAAAVEAANELRLAAILSEFINSIRPYLATSTEG